MFKQFSIVIVASLVMLLLAPYAKIGLHGLATFLDQLSQFILSFFSLEKTGTKIHTLISLILLPVLLCLIVKKIYTTVFKRSFSYFYPLLWATWLVLTSTTLLMQ